MPMIGLLVTMPQYLEFGLGHRSSRISKKQRPTHEHLSDVGLRIYLVAPR